MHFTVKLMKVITTIFCVLACLFVAAAIPIGAFFGWIWFLVLAACAALCACIMVLAKKRSAPEEPARPDFMNTDEENRRINEENRGQDGE